MSQSAGDRMRDALAAWCALVRRGAWLVVALAAALTAAALHYTAGHLTIDTSTTGMISPEVAFRRHSEAFDAAFPELRDNIVAVIDAPTPEAAAAAAEALGARLAGDEARFRGAYVPGGQAFFEESAFLYLSVDELGALADRLAAAEPLLAALAAEPSLVGLAEATGQALARGGGQAPAELAAVLARIAAVAEDAAAGRPGKLSWQALLAGDASAAAAGRTRRFVIARPRLDHGSLAPAVPAIRTIRAQAAALGLDGAGGGRLRLTGSPVLEQEELESVRLSGANAAGLSLTLVVVLLAFALRSWRLLLATAATLVAGLIWTAAFAILAIGHLNLISVAFAVLFVGLAVDFGIHFALRYREELAAAAHGEALARAAAGVGGALGLSALAAAAGFYAFLPTDFRGLAELGLISGTGMFVALVANLTVLPAIIALLPPRTRGAGAPADGGGLAAAVARRRRAVLAGALVLALAGLAVLPFARFDFNPLHLKDPEAEAVATFRELARDPETSPYSADVVAADLAAAEATARRLEALDEVGRTMTLADFVPKRQAEKLAIVDDMATFLAPALMQPAAAAPPDAAARRAAFERLRADAEAAADGGEGELAAAAGRLAAALAALGGDGAPSAAALADLERRLTAHLPPTLERLRRALSAERVGLADVPAEVRGRWRADDGRTRVEAYPRAPIQSNAELHRFARAVLSTAPSATGTAIVITEAGEVVVEAFVRASALAFALILALLAVLLRRPRDIALVVGPLALAAVLTGAGAVVLGIPFNFANVIVLPLLLGLGVASGIHLVLRGRESGPHAAVLESSTPRAVLFSALTTLASFGSLALSNHRGMNSMGELLTVAIVCILAAMLLVLPSLMAALAGREARP